MPATLGMGVLTDDVPTRWGIYAAGFEAPIIGHAPGETILNVGYTPDREGGRQRNIRIPSELVATGRDAEHRVAECISCGFDHLRVGKKSPALLCDSCRTVFARMGGAA